jgi:hypothetical protein
MGKSGNFDSGTGELAPRTGEFLAGVLALSRISRVTVALESGHGAGPALLAAARLTAHAETCLLFDRWRANPLADLAAALFHAHPDLAPAPDESLAQAVRKLQARERHSILVIFDRFDEYLERPADRPHDAAFERAFVQMANDSELDMHFLLVQDEASESLLDRFQDDIPGIGDGCLRMPAGSLVDGQDDAPAPDAGRASRRDRSFGMLLERLTAIAPVEEAAASQARHISPAPELQPPDMRQPFDDIAPAHEVQPVFDDTAMTEIPPAEPEAVPAAPAPSFASFQAAGMDAPAATPEPACPPHDSATPVPPPRRGKALAALMAAVLAVGAGLYAYRQQAPATAPDAAAKAASPASQPAAAAPASTASADKQASGTAPVSKAMPAPAAEPPAQAAAPAAPAAPATTAATAATTAPAAPATTAASSALAATGAAAGPVVPTVYVHVRSQHERDRLQAIARTLAGQGIRVVDVKVMSKGPSVADLRYFRDEDKAAALTVQKAMVSAGVAVPKLSRMNGYENSTRPGHLEAWLGADKTPEPVRHH